MGSNSIIHGRELLMAEEVGGGSQLSRLLPAAGRVTRKAQRLVISLGKAIVIYPRGQKPLSVDVDSSEILGNIIFDLLD
jgi:hypothetical protein